MMKEAMNELDKLATKYPNLFFVMFPKDAKAIDVFKNR